MSNKIFIVLIVFLQSMLLVQKTHANEPDSAYIFAYATKENNNHNGLHFAWSIDKREWHPIGPEHSFVKSDYGRWGSQKRMITPFLFRSNDGMWHSVWSLNETDGAFAHASSPDLIEWGRQSYPLLMNSGNIISPVIAFNNNDNNYTISWLSKTEDGEKAYAVNTKNFKDYGNPTPVSSLNNLRQEVLVSNRFQSGTVHKVNWETVENLIKNQQLNAYKSILYSETTRGDAERFGNLNAVDVVIKAEASKSKQISDLLMGIFYEDINYAADGGLYAELVQNRGFEYDPADRQHSDQSWNSKKAWSVLNTESFQIGTESPVHTNNKHYSILQADGESVALVNEGFNGIPIKAGESYNFSTFARSPELKTGRLLIKLIDKDGNIVAKSRTGRLNKNWKKYETVLTATKSMLDARLVIEPQFKGRVDLDIVSLFPQKTFKGRKNGLRADLAQTLADMKPSFVRFPGGCVAHGDGLNNIYHWKNTIGPIEERIPQRNIWNYHQSYGLGYFEYFQFCADIGAEPIPIVAAGVPCQNSAHHGCALGGQQGGIPMSEMDAYIQDILDLIEYANGDVKSEWGSKRAAAGHPKPFNLKYIGVGNEDLITDIFEERFTMIYNAVKDKHPEITVIGTVGPFFEGTDYREGWDLAVKLEIPIVDEHYYNPPGWYIHNQDFYDKYSRSRSKVYLGEYAAHLPGRPNNIETALTEALHLCNVERNGDVVIMTSYAPLLAREGFTQWNPNLIYFNSTEVKPTVGYWVQQLFGNNVGDEYIYSGIELSNRSDNVSKRIAKSIVRDSKTGDIIVKIVNLLPVELNTTLDMSEFNIANETVEKSVLTGAPDDREAKPTTQSLKFEEQNTLPPYSLTIFRFNTIQ
ncbi:MAG TPA: alpha-L-arabinofuranosidase [Bacteroidales bacterium]|nr:alpha-L-arabinofuranosidase [Bacteroidales bacterium]